MSEDPRALYQAVIMRHNRSPFHYEKQPEASIVIEAYNPLCGDQFKLFLEIQNGRVERAYFHGYGCAISKASTSVLMEKLEGQSLVEVRALIKKFTQAVTPEKTFPDDLDEELEAFAAAREFPARIQCALLSWEALRRYLENEESV